MSDVKNYTLGRGQIFFDQFKPGTQEVSGERYLGNTPEFNLTFESESLDHFSSDEGVREKDDTVQLQVNRSGTLITDHISVDNLALFFFGTATPLSVTGATIEGEALGEVKQGHYYQLGVSDSNPTGHRDLDLLSTGPDVKIILEDDTTPTPVVFDEGDDYTIDMVLGRIYIVPGGAIADGTNLFADYKTKTSTRERVISGSAPITGALRFIAKNPKGKNMDYFMPYVSLSPNGDFSLKSEEWQQIPLTVEVLKKGDLAALYVDGRPEAE